MRGPHSDQRHRSGRRGGVHVHCAEPVRRGHLHRLHQPRGRQGRQEEQVGQQAQQERQPEAGRRCAAAATTAGGLHATAAATTVVHAATAGQQIDATLSRSGITLIQIWPQSDVLHRNFNNLFSI